MTVLLLIAVLWVVGVPALVVAAATLRANRRAASRRRYVRDAEHELFPDAYRLRGRPVPRRHEAAERPVEARPLSLRAP